jgi:hypothetical protein
VLNGTRASATTITADSPEPPVPTAADLAYFGHPGPSFIEGHLVVNTKLFGTLVFPNTKVYLYPYTDYTYWIQLRSAAIFTAGKDEQVGVAPDLRQYNHVTTTGDNGYFIFRNLPYGNYIIVALATHEERDHPLEERHQTGVDQNGNIVSVPVEQRGLVIRVEDDVALGVVSLTPPGGLDVHSLNRVGISTCCDASF